MPNKQALAVLWDEQETKNSDNSNESGAPTCSHLSMPKKNALVVLQVV